MNWKARNKKEIESAISIKENSQMVLDAFKAIEQRDDETFRALLHSEFEIHWPPSLPYGGSNAPTWSETWEPLQPTEVERKMDARVVASGEDEVVVLWRQRGVNASGDRFEGEVLGLYQLRNGKLARAQMFYFDTAAVASFLTKA
jgi:ketosteroid isomerase-like protein